MAVWRTGYSGEEIQVFQPSRYRKRPINRAPLGRIVARRTRITLEFYLFDLDDLTGLEEYERKN